MPFFLLGESHRDSTCRGSALKEGFQAPFIVIDPREIKLSHYARIWLRPFCGHDEILLLAFLQLLLSSEHVKEVNAGGSSNTLEGTGTCTLIFT